MTCLALITREYKRAKADSIWPVTNGQPWDVIPNVVDGQRVEVCFGEVSLKLSSRSVAVWGGEDAELTAEWKCSRCKNPYVPRRLDVDGAVASGEVDIEQLQEWLG